MPEIPETGPEAIQAALAAINVDDIEQKGRELVKTGRKTKRNAGVKLLHIAQGMRRNNITPADYMVSAVPVIPPKYRPVAAQGDSLIPGDANVLYKDLIDIRDSYNEESDMFGKEYAGSSGLALYDAVKSVYGYGEAVKPKTKAKDIQGFLKKIVGKTSKYSYVQSKMLSKTQDNVGRSTIIADPDLSIDEIGIPEELAYTMYAPYVQRRLKQMGYKDADAVRALRDRTPDSYRALEYVTNERPVLYTRDPAWYRFNIAAGKVKLVKGNAIATNPITIGSMGGDFDGDTISLHVPSSTEAVKEAYEKLMPSADPFSDRDTEKVVLLPKQEQILGLFTAQTAPSTKAYSFNSEAEAIDAIRRGQIPLSADVNIRGMGKMAADKKEEGPKLVVCKGVQQSKHNKTNVKTRNFFARVPATANAALSEAISAWKNNDCKKLAALVREYNTSAQVRDLGADWMWDSVESVSVDWESV